jgi:hypothetical protein
MACELREWNANWVKNLSHNANLSEEKANIILDRFIILHHVFSNRIFWKTHEF